MRSPTPRERRLFERAAEAYGIDPAILWGLEGAESSHEKKARSPKGAQGWMQFMPDTAEGMGVNPYKRRSAVRGAARYLSQYKSRGLRGMLQAYNAGPYGSDNPESRQHYLNTLENAKSWKGSGKPRTMEVTTRKAKYVPGKVKVDWSSALVDEMLTGDHRKGGLLKATMARVERDPAYTQRTDPKTIKAKVKEVTLDGGKGKYGGIVPDGWKGSRSAGESLGLNAILKATGNSATTKRATVRTASGNVSDHYEGNKDSYAWDISGGDIDKAMRKLARALGLKTHKGLQNVTKTIDGRTYRFQLIWQAPDHYDHGHLGVDRIDTPG